MTATATKTIIAETTARSASRPDVTYTQKVWSTGDITCDCPGWVYKRAGQPRGCRHTKALAPA